ncbi:MAG: hypothetical protein V4617_02315 [Gemmatimonadota bacterium]
MKRLAGIIALVVGVTTVGLGAGALFVSPMATTLPWLRPAAQGFAVMAVLGALAVWLMPTRTPARKSTTVAMPSFSMGRVDRSARGIAALAEAGTALTDIARRTGLPVDAVSMLLSISGNRAAG